MLAAGRQGLPIAPTDDRATGSGVLPLLGVMVLLFLARSLVTFPIEHVDAAFKYLAAAEFVRGAGLSVLLENHHTMRWSEVLPQAFVTWITQFRYEGLYLLPLTAFALTGGLLWRGLRAHLTLSQQGLLLALLFIEPVALTHTGQLLNPPFGVLYAVLAVTALAVSGPVPAWRVVMAALAFFAAYGAHSTYLSFSAAGVAWLLVFRRQPLAALGLAGLVALLMALETLVFNAIAAEQLGGGRLEALLSGSHFEGVLDRFPVVEPLELLTRWFRLPWFDLALVAGFLGCAAWLTLSPRARAAAPPFLVLCLLVGGAYAVAITFAVVSLSPLRPIQPLRVMYLEPFLPFAVVGTVALLAGLMNRLRPRVRLFLEATAVFGMVLLLAAAAVTSYSWEHVVNNRLNAFFWRSEAQLGEFNERLRRGEIILVGENRHALEKLVRYRGPARFVRSGRAPGIVAAPELVPGVVCVRGIRAIPLERNDRPCGARALQAAADAGARGN